MNIKGSLIYNNADKTAENAETAANEKNATQLFETKRQAIDLEGKDFIDLPKYFKLKFNLPGKKEGCDFIESIRVHISLPEVHNYLYHNIQNDIQNDTQNKAHFINSRCSCSKIY